METNSTKPLERLASSLTEFVKLEKQKEEVQLKSGYHLFSDVFRRADKNDDGLLSVDEFEDYFKDDLLTQTDLLHIFGAVDTDKSKDISLDELFTFFQQDFDPFAKLFSSLENMHKSLSECLQSCSQKYHQQDFFQQFKSRFFLREFESQLSSLKRPVQVAIEGMEKVTALSYNRSIVQQEHRDAQFSFVHPSPRHLAINEELHTLREQVNRLSKLVDKLEHAPLTIEAPEVQEFDNNQNEFLIVSREMPVLIEKQDEFKKALKHYLKSTKNEEGCYHTYVGCTKDKSLYYLFEVWTTEKLYQNHLTSSHYNEHLKLNANYISSPEKTNSLRTFNLFNRTK